MKALWADVVRAWQRNIDRYGSVAPPSPASPAFNKVELCFQLSSFQTSAGAAVFLGDSVFHKALWNWYLLRDDGSSGVHNPSYVLDALSATTAALQAFTP